MASGNNYPFGNPGVVNTGAKPNGFANADIRWEESTQTDIGLDLAFFNSALAFSMDWYKKKNHRHADGYPGSCLFATVLPQVTWVSWITALGNSISGTASALVMLISTSGQTPPTWTTCWWNWGTKKDGRIDDSHKIGTLTRAQNGWSLPFFYGWKTDGSFQNWAEVEAGIQPNAQPGDVRFVDIDNNGVINDDDRTMIGKGMPDLVIRLQPGFHLERD